MANPFCDKYFTKSKIVAQTAGLNPIVTYRVFTRFDGIAAFQPMAYLATQLFEEDFIIEVLKDGEPFKAGDTIATFTGYFQDLVEHETQILQWTALPAYCAKQASEITEVAENKIVLDFAARHLFDPVSVSLASYGASVGGIKGHSTDVGANALTYLKKQTKEYLKTIKSKDKDILEKGVGTTPHALLAIFKGNYKDMAKAYLETFPNEKFVALIDYNNKEIEDTLSLLSLYGKKLAGVRIDTCGENHAQIGFDEKGNSVYAKETGVTEQAVAALRNALDENGGEHVKIFLSSGFNAEKTARFMDRVPGNFDGTGTGSFIPKVPTATADICFVDGVAESKVGREWGVKSLEEFGKRNRDIYISEE